MEVTMKGQFVKYVSRNILGMVGISLYILADTFFISLAEGADGIAALNLVLPIYALIFAIGAMIGVGSAIRFKIMRAKGMQEADTYFANAILYVCLISIVFMLVGVLVPDKLVGLLGGDETIVAIGTSYTRIFMIFTPFFMLNYIFTAFVRNDGAPTLAMVATLAGSLLNILMDYILMFPCGLGMAGAALATAMSPVAGMLICCLHFRSKSNTIVFRPSKLSFYQLFRFCQLGVSAFVGEISSGVITAVFNVLILGLVGNVGVAAYGVVANTALVAVAIFNGIAQGSQPIISECYGKGDKKAARKILNMGMGTALICAGMIVLTVLAFAEEIVQFFNSEQSVQLASYAATGIRLYFLGFFFAGLNIVATGYLSAIEEAGWAFATSMMRGFVAIVCCAIVLSLLFGMTGVWMAYAGAEGLTLLVVLMALYRKKNNK